MFLSRGPMKQERWKGLVYNAHKYACFFWSWVSQAQRSRAIPMCVRAFLFKCVCLYLCACERGGIFCLECWQGVCVCVRAYLCLCACVCICVRVREGGIFHLECWQGVMEGGQAVTYDSLAITHRTWNTTQAAYCFLSSLTIYLWTNKPQ